ncbi:MAG: PAS domain-containing protein [Polyangiaceae bacterium]|nr:PAS domain-containing protein [Polyangiaceae bacterium]
MKPASSFPANVLLGAAAIAAVWFLGNWLLGALFGNVIGVHIVVAILAAIAGSIVLTLSSPHASTGLVTRMVDVAHAMRDGDLSARAPVFPDSSLAPLSTALNDLAESVARSSESAKKQVDLVSGIVDGMPEGVVVFDRKGQIVLANVAARRLALQGEDILGKTAIEAMRNAAFADAIERVLAKGDSGSREIEIGGVLGRRLLVRTSPRTDKGSGGGAVALLHDVTDLRRLETIRTEFVANVSHELRTPVTAITTAAETLLGGALEHPADAAEFVEMIERNARRLRRLVDDILDLSKIEGKAYELAPKLELIRPVFVAAKKLVDDAAARRRMRVVIDAPPEIEAWLDRHAFEQVIGNLLDNAIKYAGEGSFVTLSAKAEKEAVLVSVADTGAGIAPEHLDRLFERFYRVDTGRSREMGGTGLGLAIVKHLVEAMDGTITVKSTLGRGTTFTLRLSRTEPEATLEVPSGEPPSTAEVVRVRN